MVLPPKYSFSGRMISGFEMFALVVQGGRRTRTYGFPRDEVADDFGRELARKLGLDLPLARDQGIIRPHDRRRPRRSRQIRHRRAHLQRSPQTFRQSRFSRLVPGIFHTTIEPCSPYKIDTRGNSLRKVRKICWCRSPVGRSENPWLGAARTSAERPDSCRGDEIGIAARESLRSHRHPCRAARGAFSAAIWVQITIGQIPANNSPSAAAG
jgi:hypothetical protein